MKIKPQIVIISMILIFTFGISITKIMGVWATESTKTPAKFASDSKEFAEEYRADDIRGSYTFGEISNLFDIPLEDISQAFGVEKEKAEQFKCKDLEIIYTDTPFEIGTGSVKMFVAFYLGQPYDLVEDTYLLNYASDILINNEKITDDQKEYLSKHLIDMENLKDVDSKIDITSEVSKNISYEIKGSTYLKDIAENYNIPIKDFADAFLISELEVKNFQVKDIKDKFSSNEVEIGTTSVDMFANLFAGNKYDFTSSNSFLPEEAVSILENKNVLTEEAILFLKTHTFRK